MASNEPRVHDMELNIELLRSHATLLTFGYRHVMHWPNTVDRARKIWLTVGHNRQIEGNQFGPNGHLNWNLMGVNECYFITTAFKFWRTKLQFQIESITWPASGVDDPAGQLRYMAIKFVHFEAVRAVSDILPYARGFSRLLEDAFHDEVTGDNVRVMYGGVPFLPGLAEEAGSHE